MPQLATQPKESSKIFEKEILALSSYRCSICCQCFEGVFQAEEIYTIALDGDDLRFYHEKCLRNYEENMKRQLKQLESWLC